MNNFKKASNFKSYLNLCTNLIMIGYHPYEERDSFRSFIYMDFIVGFELRLSGLNRHDQRDWFIFTTFFQKNKGDKELTQLFCRDKECTKKEMKLVLRAVVCEEKRPLCVGIKWAELIVEKLLNGDLCSSWHKLKRF